MQDTYDRPSLTAASLAAWREEISAALTVVTRGFEQKHGYAPGENAIHPPDAGDRSAAGQLEAESAVFADLALYYSEIGSVVMSDVGNAYFLSSGAQALEDRVVLPEAGGARVPAVLIGSDGGGIQYAVGPDGAVWRSRSASAEGEFDRITDDLGEFLDLLRRSVHRFDHDGRTGLV